MLNYFDKKKTLDICEDSLTSTVFDLLKYLPTEVFYSILRESLYHKKLPIICGEIEKIHFWEKWNSKNTTNSLYIEPDVFIRFSNFDIIIEAKRYNNNQQSEKQMKDEILAYFNEYKNDNKDIYFIQLGGLNDTSDIPNINIEGYEVIICKTDWTKILDRVVFEKEKIQNINYGVTNSLKRILNDLIIGFEIHGFFKKIWLDSLNACNIEHKNTKMIYNGKQ